MTAPLYVRVDGVERVVGTLDLLTPAPLPRGGAEPREVGERVRLARTALGISQAALAARLGSYQTTVSRIEAGTQALTLASAAALAPVLSISLDELAYGHEGADR